MIKNEYQTLWNKIQNFTFDDENAVTTFSGKLAVSQNWSPEFTQRVIEEYRRFMLLCCVSENGAAPSKLVDEVWHLHLTYTRSYWTDFCRNTLGKDIHHHPSAGGMQEDHRHLEWYKETRELYQSIFEASPPPDIWPLVRKAVPVPAEPGFNRKWTFLATIVILILVPFLFSIIAYGKSSPFSLSGPQFLLFFPLFGAAILIIYYLYHADQKEEILKISADYFHEDITPFEVGAFLYGKHRAIQTAVADLAQRGLLTSGGDHVVRVTKNNYKPDVNETNPLIIQYEQEKNGSIHSYKDIVDKWYKKPGFIHPALNALDKFAHRKQPFIIALSVILYGMAVVRLIQGLVNHKPVFFLILETIALMLIFHLLRSVYARRVVVYSAVRKYFIDKHKQLADRNAQVIPRFATGGRHALTGIPEVAFLSGIFVYTLNEHYRRSLNDEGTNILHRRGSDGNSTTSCGSSGGDGGGCSGGSGCGGCGGGGD